METDFSFYYHPYHFATEKIKSWKPKNLPVSIFNKILLKAISFLKQHSYRWYRYISNRIMFGIRIAFKGCQIIFEHMQIKNCIAYDINCAKKVLVLFISLSFLFNVSHQDLFLFYRGICIQIVLLMETGWQSKLFLEVKKKNWIKDTRIQSPAHPH